MTNEVSHYYVKVHCFMLQPQTEVDLFYSTVTYIPASTLTDAQIDITGT